MIFAPNRHDLASPLKKSFFFLFSFFTEGLVRAMVYFRKTHNAEWLQVTVGLGWTCLKSVLGLRYEK